MIQIKHALFGLCVMSALPAHAQSQAERLAQMMSKNYAMQSLQSVMLGDLESARNFALRAFPPDPTEQEAMALPEAMFALELAMGARIAHIDNEGTGLYSVDSTGTRAFAGFYDPRPEVNTQYVTPAIYDPRDGALIGALDEVAASSSPEFSPEFSPDGKLLAYPTFPRAKVQLFSSEDGSLVRELTTDVSAPFDWLVPVPLGFSADGSQYAYGYHHDRGGILVWNIADGSLVSHLAAEGEGAETWVPLGWDHDGGFAVQKIINDTGTGMVTNAGLERWSQDGGKVMLSDLAGVIDTVSLKSITFPGVPVVFMSDEMRLAAIDLETGAVRFTTEVEFPEIALVRNGTAFAIRPFDIESLDDFQVFDLNGNRLQPTGRDLIPLAQAAISRSGMIAAVPKNATRHTYLGQDLPEGAELYKAAWEGLDNATKQAINQDRVVRP